MRRITSMFRREERPAAPDVAASPASVTTAPASAKEDYSTKHKRADVRLSELLLEYDIPAHPGHHKRGAPSYQVSALPYPRTPPTRPHRPAPICPAPICPGPGVTPSCLQDTWVRGLHLMMRDVAYEKIDLPPTHLITATVPEHFKKTKGFNPELVRKHFACAPKESDGDPSTADEVYVGEGVAEVPEQPSPPGKQRKFYSLGEMMLFQDMVANNPGKTLHAVIQIAQKELPQTFLARTKYDTFKSFPAAIEKLKQQAEDKAKKVAEKKARAKRRRLLNRKEAPSVADKQEEAILPPVHSVALHAAAAAVCLAAVVCLAAAANRACRWACESMS